MALLLLKSSQCVCEIKASEVLKMGILHRHYSDSHKADQVAVSQQLIQSKRNRLVWSKVGEGSSNFDVLL